MGAFDFVRDYAADCPKCGRQIVEWQTKDNVLPYLNTVGFRTVDNFSALCPDCKTLISIKFRTKPPEQREHSDYGVAFVVYRAVEDQDDEC